MSDVTSLRDTIVPKSDQANAEDFLTGPRTITVTDVRRSSSPDQPVSVFFDGDSGKPYKPCKTMRKLLVFAWGDDGREWVGRSMTLYCDPEVKWGGVKVGGVRISHLSHIDRDIQISLTATKGKKEPVSVRRLAVQKPAPKQYLATSPAPSDDEIEPELHRLYDAASTGMAALVAAWKATPAPIRAAISPDGKCPDNLKQQAAKADAQPKE